MNAETIRFLFTTSSTSPTAAKLCQNSEGVECVDTAEARYLESRLICLHTAGHSLWYQQNARRNRQRRNHSKHPEVVWESDQCVHGFCHNLTVDVWNRVVDSSPTHRGRYEIDQASQRNWSRLIKMSLHWQCKDPPVPEIYGYLADCSSASIPFIAGRWRVVDPQQPQTQLRVSAARDLASMS